MKMPPIICTISKHTSIETYAFEHTFRWESTLWRVGKGEGFPSKAQAEQAARDAYPESVRLRRMIIAAKRKRG